MYTQEARKVVGYTQKLQELHSKLLTMIEEEAYSTFPLGLHLHLREQVGTHMHGNLEETIAMA